MSKYSYEIYYSNGDIFKGLESDEIFETEKEAYDAALECVNCVSVGRETLYLSNPGDYPYDENEDNEYEIAIIEIE